MPGMRFLRRGALAALGLWAGSAVAQDAVRSPPVEQRPAPSSRSLALVGVVAASRSLDLFPQVEGRLEQLKVRLGDRVEAGQLVALLDTRTRQLEVSARQAQLKAAEAELARTHLLQQQAQLVMEREKRIRDYTAAESIEKAENAVALAAVDVQLATARHAAAQTELALASENLEQARIRAPFTGVVSEEYLQPGMMASRTTPILRLVGEGRLLRFAIPESLAGAVRLGDEVRVRIAGSVVPLQGIVERISPELDATSRHVKAEARLTIPAEARGLVLIGAVVPVELSRDLSARAGDKGR